VVVRREDLADERGTLGGELEALRLQEPGEPVDLLLDLRHSLYGQQLRLSLNFLAGAV